MKPERLTELCLGAGLRINPDPLVSERRQAVLLEALRQKIANGGAGSLALTAAERQELSTEAAGDAAPTAEPSAAEGTLSLDDPVWTEGFFGGQVDDAIVGIIAKRPDIL